MAEQQWINPAIYGGEELTPRTGAAAGVSSYTPPEQVSTVQGFDALPVAAQGQAQLEQNNREQATVGQAVKAAVSEMGTTKVLNWLSAPSFAGEAGYSPADLMNKASFPLSKEDEEYLQQSRSAEEGQYRMDNLLRRNQASQAMGDHPFISMATMMFDPVYLGADVVAAGAGRGLALANVGRAGQRVASAVTAGGFAAGISAIEATQSPVSVGQFAANVLLNGAAAGMFYSAGKLQQIDSGYPSNTLHTLAQQVEDQANGIARHPESHPDFVGPVQVVRDTFVPTDLTRPRVQGGSDALPTVQYGPSEPKIDPATGLPEIVDYSGVQRALGVSADDAAAIVRDGRVVSVNTVDDIAAHSVGVRTGATRIESDAKAVYLPGDDKVFLVQSNIKPGDDVKGILLHEYGVHMNAERVLGTAKLGEMLNTLEDLALKGNRRAREAYDSVPRDTPLHLVREEALGYYVEKFHAKVGDNIVSRFVSAVREKLRNSGLLNVKYTEADIMNLVRKAAKGGEKAKSHSFDATFPYAWHGSPVRGIDRLDTAFMGSGEGNAAFGWGHYTTSEKGVALDYRNKESTKRGIDPEEGGLYRVKLKGEHGDYLDLDARVQSDKVAAVLRKFGVRDGITGKSAYEYLARSMGSQKAASEALYAEGVLGNRYATGRTRNTGDRSSNYVLFHNDVVDMQARYSRPTKQQAGATVAQAMAARGEWSLHRSLSALGTWGREIADLLVDDPINMQGNSAFNQQRAIRADLAAYQYEFEDLVKNHMADNGWSLHKRMMNPTEAAAAQKSLMREVGLEMLRRDRLARDGMPITHNNVPAHIKAMADSLDVTHKAALQEMKRAGVTGADTIAEQSGYFSRRWEITKIENIIADLVAGGRTLPEAQQLVNDWVSVSIQRANGWDAQLASDVAKAILDRARAKGYFEDNAFRRHNGLEAAKEVRDILEQSGISGNRMQRVMDVLTGVADEQGRVPQLKSRVDMHMDEALTMPDGSTRTIADMLDLDMVNLTERYLDTASSQAALARKGLKTTEDIDNLRTKFLAGVEGQGKREEAAYLFDQTMNALRGMPVGERMSNIMRNMQAATQMMGLASSGLWQMTEYANAMAHYGVLRTVGHAIRELPGFRQLLGADPAEAEHLKNVLTRNAAQDVRLRPFVQKLEDNFEIDPTQGMQMAMQQAKQLVPYINGMKYIQGHQARTVANLIVDIVQRGVTGNQKALDTLYQYGLEGHSVGGIRADIMAHGMDTARWSDATWDAVRAPLTKMMDDAVLRARTGEIPAFAQFSQTGKFLFTFRSFVLASHNKVLARTLNTSGFAGLGLLALYQFPLTVAATAANHTIQGKKDFKEGELVKSAIGQMGAMGLLGELWGAVTGTKQQFGSPGTIGIDRMYKLAGDMKGAVLDGHTGHAAASFMNSIPLMSLILPLRALGESLKASDDK